MTTDVSDSFIIMPEAICHLLSEGAQLALDNPAKVGCDGPPHCVVAPARTRKEISQNILQATARGHWSQLGVLPGQQA